MLGDARTVGGYSLGDDEVEALIFRYYGYTATLLLHNLRFAHLCKTKTSSFDYSDSAWKNLNDEFDLASDSL